MFRVYTNANVCFGNITTDRWGRWGLPLWSVLHQGPPPLSRNVRLSGSGWGANGRCLVDQYGGCLGPLQSISPSLPVPSKTLMHLSSLRRVTYHSRLILRPRQRCLCHLMVPADPNPNEPRILVEAVRLFLEALKIGMRLFPTFVGPLAFALGRERASTDVASIADARELLRKDSVLDQVKQRVSSTVRPERRSEYKGHLALERFVFLISFLLASSLWAFPELRRYASSPDQEQNQLYNRDCGRQSPPRPPAWQCPRRLYHEESDEVGLSISGRSTAA